MCHSPLLLNELKYFYMYVDTYLKKTTCSNMIDSHPTNAHTSQAGSDISDFLSSIMKECINANFMFC